VEKSMKNITKQQKGFTIIEVLIVLAIAGLIILIVFLAVPALQRNSRNTQRRSDAAKLGSAVVEWSNNNNGSMPTASADQTAAVSNTQLGIYNGAVSWGTTFPGNENSVVVAVNNKCNGSGAIAGQNRSVAILYKVETGGAAQNQCVDG